jgi:hypothetical protein
MNMTRTPIPHSKWNPIRHWKNVTHADMNTSEPLSADVVAIIDELMTFDQLERSDAMVFIAESGDYTFEYLNTLVHQRRVQATTRALIASYRSMKTQKLEKEPFVSALGDMDD